MVLYALIQRGRRGGSDDRAGGPLRRRHRPAGPRLGPGRGGRRRRGSAQLGARIAILVLVGGYLLLPLFAMAEFSTRGDFGSRIAGRVGSRSRTTRTSSRRSSTSLAIAALTVVGMLLLLVPTMAWTVIRGPAQAPGGVPVPAAAGDPGRRPGRRHRAHLLDPWARASARSAHPADPGLHRHHPRAAVRPPGDRRRPAVDRRPDPGRGGPEPRRQLAAGDLPGHRAEHPRRDPVGRGDLASRWCSASSRSRRCCQLRHAAGGDQPARQARSVRRRSRSRSPPSSSRSSCCRHHRASRSAVPTARRGAVEEGPQHDRHEPRTDRDRRTASPSSCSTCIAGTAPSTPSTG